MCAALNPFHSHWIQCVNSVEADISYKTNTDWLCFGKKGSTLETKRFVASNQHTNLHWVVWNVSTSKRSFCADKHGTRRVNKSAHRPTRTRFAVKKIGNSTCFTRVTDWCDLQFSSCLVFHSTSWVCVWISTIPSFFRLTHVQRRWQTIETVDTCSFRPR